MIPGRSRRRAPAVLGPALAAVLVLATSCGGDDGGGNGGGDSALRLGAAAERGREVAQQKGCMSCHTDDGDRGTGPTWQGIWGTTVELEGGGTTVVDRAYLERSVREPRAEVVEGFQPLMPTYDLTDPEIDAVAAYLDALAQG